MRIPELLAPAGSAESLVAAINAGADAVYLGGNRFSARNYAENFDESSIVDAVDYAHLRGVRIYVTVNTVIRDSELPDMAGFILFLYRAGVDAILVQDIGVATLVREIAPGLPLHASTQMTIYNREGVAWAREQGFSRVVLARELSLEEIEDIASAPECQGIGLELFVHGALCYSYSGQCLLSSVIGGRSGNRGMCAQPCRKPYALVSGQMDMYGRPVSLSKTEWDEKYLLSTRDLCSYRDLESIVRAPIASLKIEGRMRSPRYVATAVSVYRNAIDAIALGTWSPSDKDEEKLALAFNRGFTRGYLKGALHSDIMSRSHPDHRGIMVGSVASYNPQTHLAGIRLSGRVVPNKGDGIVFIDPSSGNENGLILQGLPLKDGDGIQVPVPKAAKPGDVLYLTRRRDDSRKDKGGQEKHCSIPLDLVVTWDEARRPVINGTMPGKDGIPVHYRHVGTPMEPAENMPLTGGQIIRQITRTGDTPFVVKDIELEYPGNMFTPVSLLNKLRRDFLRGAESAIVSSWKPGPVQLSDAMEEAESLIASFRATAVSGRCYRSRSLNISVYSNSAEVAIAAIEAGCDKVYFEPETKSRAMLCRNGNITKPAPDPYQEIPTAMKDLLDLTSMEKSQIFWKWPSIPNRAFIDRSVSILPEVTEMGLVGVMIDSPGLATRLRRLFPDLLISGGAGINVFNHVTAGSLSIFSSLTLSPELPYDDVTRLSAWFCYHGAPAIEVIAQGNLEVLNSRDCIPAGMPEPGCFRSGIVDNTFFGLQDSTGRIFQISIDPWCHTHISNSVETCLIDSVPGLIHTGVRSIAIDARQKTPAYAKEMVSLYREAIRRSSGSSKQGQFTDLLTSVKKIALGGITSASFRGNVV